MTEESVEGVPQRMKAFEEKKGEDSGNIVNYSGRRERRKGEENSKADREGSLFFSHLLASLHPRLQGS